MMVQVHDNMLSYPFFRCQGDKFFSNRIKNLLFLFCGLDRKLVSGEKKRFQRREISTKWQNSPEPSINFSV